MSHYIMPSVYHNEIRVARIPHVCTECGGAIEAGEQYEAVAGLWDGRWQHWKTCAPCLEIRQRVCPNEWGFGRVLNDAFEDGSDDVRALVLRRRIAVSEQRADAP